MTVDLYELYCDYLKHLNQCILHCQQLQGAKFKWRNGYFKKKNNNNNLLWSHFRNLKFEMEKCTFLSAWSKYRFWTITLNTYIICRYNLYPLYIIPPWHISWACSCHWFSWLIYSGQLHVYTITQVLLSGSWPHFVHMFITSRGITLLVANKIWCVIFPWQPKLIFVKFTLVHTITRFSGMILPKFSIHVYHIKRKNSIDIKKKNLPSSLPLAILLRVITQVLLRGSYPTSVHMCNSARKIAARPGNQTQDHCIKSQTLYHITIKPACTVRQYKCVSTLSSRAVLELVPELEVLELLFNIQELFLN